MTRAAFPPTSQVCRVEQFANLVYELTGCAAHTVSGDMGAIITVADMNVRVPFEWVEPLSPLAAEMLELAKRGEL